MKLLHIIVWGLVMAHAVLLNEVLVRGGGGGRREPKTKQANNNLQLDITDKYQSPCFL